MCTWGTISDMENFIRENSSSMVEILRWIIATTPFRKKPKWESYLFRLLWRFLPSHIFRKKIIRSRYRSYSGSISPEKHSWEVRSGFRASEYCIPKISLFALRVNKQKIERKAIQSMLCCVAFSEGRKSLNIWGKFHYVYEITKIIFFWYS